MKKADWAAFCLAVLVSLVCRSGVSAGEAAGVYQDFANEEIKPYVKIMEGPWVDNVLGGGKGNYRVTAKIPKNAKYVLGLFDNKVSRAGADERSAVVLLDGVNPLAPGEKIPVAEIDKRDVSSFRKVPFDGVTFNSRGSDGKDCYVKVVDAKEDGVPGPVKPFTVPAGRSGKNLGRMDVFIFAGPAYSPVPGQKVSYGKPLVRYSIFFEE